MLGLPGARLIPSRPQPRGGLHHVARAVLASRVRALRRGSHWRGVQVSATVGGASRGREAGLGVLGPEEAQSGCQRGSGPWASHSSNRQAGFLTSPPRACRSQAAQPARVPALLPPTLTHLLPRGSRLVPQPPGHVPSPPSPPPPLSRPCQPPPSPGSPPPPASIRQYELVVHTDMDTAVVYTGEMGRLKSYENQKP